MRMPLAWMIGAMVFTTAGTLGGLRLHMYPWLRAVMIAVLGVMLGSAFTPEILASAKDWLPTFAGLVVYVMVVGLLVLVYFRKVAGYDLPTAFFSAAPGGLNEMIFAGTEAGGDERTISLIHSARVLLMVLTIPVWFRFSGGYDAARRAAAGIHLIDVPLVDVGVMAMTGIVGALAARAIRMPAFMLTGPLLASAVVHASGLTDSRPPTELIALAQLIVGAAVGCRFLGVRLSFLGRTLGHAVVASAILLTASVTAALALRQISDAPFEALVLAYAPGGLAEMSLIALALGIDTAFVASHHIFRIVLVVILAPTAFRIGGWASGPGGPGSTRDEGEDT
jgi:membrane AbrB-like protein